MPRQSVGPAAQEHYDRVSALAAALGEPFVSLFEPAEIEQILHEIGFRGISHFGPAELVSRYFDGYEIALDGFQRLVVASVG